MSIASGRNTAEKPLRDVVLNREELVQHALKLAQSHAESGMTSSRKTLLPRLSENIRSLRAAYREISDYVK
ncbi:MAG TPA: hypothetical protein VHQ46_06360, partial [Desulfobacteria bacterium]|nr:hypothetical protein [Desulfobacteria bacterium]